MSQELLGGSLDAVMNAESSEDFRQEIVRFAHDMEFDFVSAMTVVDLSLERSEFINVDNRPADMLQALQGQGRPGQRDPVMQHCKRASVPIVWNQSTYVQRQLGGMWEDQAAFGYRNGVAVAIHAGDGRHFMLGIDRPKALPADARDLTRIVAHLQLFAVHAENAAKRLFVPLVRQEERPHLTRREVEVLTWTMEGKTAWEVGVILQITERTTVLHLQNAMKKLDAVNKHQAVLKALRLGLIQ
ncbi:helix-turn-helix transcriptional regulator [Ideonella livida]|uniref:LuxR family transcriptional regulator n=1 Tax=Ideonella livida TaxID=2707176 RepID=A0A7C9PIQ8_9BURK|nr:LuxR family transcriptional regulator [Ideonella livida]NDY92709.1 LuxR family transcriptional regulator [Ideonella livida]